MKLFFTPSGKFLHIREGQHFVVLTEEQAFTLFERLADHFSPNPTAAEAKADADAAKPAMLGMKPGA